MKRVFIFLALAGVFCATGASAQTAMDEPTGSVILKARGEGAQVYTCKDGHWTLKEPDAKLLDDSGKVIGKHFAGPSWQLEDGSLVKGALVSSSPAPDSSAVPWLLLKAVPESGKGKLAEVAFIRRTETRGGKAPAAACTDGNETRVEYSATYTFYGKP